MRLLKTKLTNSPVLAVSNRALECAASKHGEGAVGVFQK